MEITKHAHTQRGKDMREPSKIAAKAGRRSTNTHTLHTFHDAHSKTNCNSAAASVARRSLTSCTMATAKSTSSREPVIITCRGTPSGNPWNTSTFAWLVACHVHVHHVHVQRSSGSNVPFASAPARETKRGQGHVHTGRRHGEMHVT